MKFQVKINSSYILRHLVVNILTHLSGKHVYIELCQKATK